MPTTPPDPPPGARGPSPAPKDRLDELEYELGLSREIRRRTEGQVRRLEARVAAAEAEQAHLRAVLDQREWYLAAIHRSRTWRVAQALRRLVGREW